MYRCDAWLNGKSVGQVVWNPNSGAVEIQCSLKEGWIYRAVLICGDTETFRFGVLVPGKCGFTAKGTLPHKIAKIAHQHCEVLRVMPDECYQERNWLIKSQVQPWISGVFALDPEVSLILRKKTDIYYRIYNCKNYLLIPIETDREDPLVEIYCVGNPICMDSIWYLCIQIDHKGKIIPWRRDEN